jgi:glycosyltransferase involved in cell wall biosynthesis
VRLTVLSVAYPLAPVSEDAVGGAEQVLSALDRALVKAGHRSLVVAAAGSRTAGTLLPLDSLPDVLDDRAKQQAQRAARRAILEALDRYPVDLVHLHGIDFWQYMPPDGVPVLATLHLPPEWYPPAIWSASRPQTWLHGVSANQHRRCPPSSNLLPPVPNGVDLANYRPRQRKAGFALLLGRICPEKGIHHALDAATAAGIPLYIGGQVYGYEEHRRYFERELQPRLHPPHRLLGPVGGQRKRRLLRAARCVLIPSLAPETSSLVAMEALASGTPVIAYQSGALADLIRHGETGLLVRDVDEMASAIRAIDRISPTVCRRFAETQCGAGVTTASYLRLYQDLSRRQVDTDHADRHHAIRV